jgi:hypothetical protein
METSWNPVDVAEVIIGRARQGVKQGSVRASAGNEKGGPKAAFSACDIR